MKRDSIKTDQEIDLISILHCFAKVSAKNSISDYILYLQ